MIRELIAPTADAVSEPVAVPRNFFPGAVVVIDGSHLSDAAEILVWKRLTSTGSWERLRDYPTGTLVTITATSGPAKIGTGAMRLGVTKSASIYPVGVYSITQDLEGKGTDV